MSFKSNSKLKNKAFVPVLLLQKKCNNLGTSLKKEDVKTARHQASAAEYKVEAHSQNYQKFGDLGALWQHHGNSHEALLVGPDGQAQSVLYGLPGSDWQLAQGYPKYDLMSRVDVP